jgi:hypothetical protein
MVRPDGLLGATRLAPFGAALRAFKSAFGRLVEPLPPSSKRGISNTIFLQHNQSLAHLPLCCAIPTRNTLALIRNAGIEPTVIEYLKTPRSRRKDRT